MTIRITPLHSMGANERGEGFEIFAPRASKDYMLVKRNAGTISGNHYHEGLVSEKSPEIAFLVSGTLKLITKDLSKNLVEEFIIDTPSMIEIFPMTVHVFEAVTDIMFLECNSLETHKKDTKPYEIFTHESSSK